MMLPLWYVRFQQAKHKKWHAGWAGKAKSMLRSYYNGINFSNKYF